MAVVFAPLNLAGGFAGALVDFFTSARWLIVVLLTLLALAAFRNRATRTWVHLLREVAIVVPAYFVYFMVRGIVEGRAQEAFGRAARLIDLERALGIFWEPTLQNLIVGERAVVNFMNWVYIWGHWPLILAVALWLFFFHRQSYTLYRNAFLISGAIGLIIFATLPVAPPRFMDSWGFVDTVTLHSRAYRLLQPPALVNQYAAMPSLHFGWNLLIGIAIFRHASSPVMKLVGALSPVVVFLSIVLTANHYILDALAGGAVALLGLMLAVALRERLFRRPAPRTAVV